MTGVLRKVGRYDLLEVIGRGGAAVVYLAIQRDLSRQVALKELAPQIAGDPSFAHRFIEESRLAGSLSHPNIVTVHEYFEEGGQPFIAMEYLPNGSLRSHLTELALAQVIGLCEGVLAGLEHGAERGIIHRDLKPENLLISGDGRVKIADFGVARAYNNASPRSFATVTGTTIGTPAYMAPEQALGGDLSPATDLYSLGVIVWEALAGQTPFAGSETPVAMLYRTVHETVPPIATVRADLNPKISAWLDRMLAKAPENRFPSARAAWEELEDAAIELLGPRWHRHAAILASGSSATAARTPTPVVRTIIDPPETPGRRPTDTPLRPAAQPTLLGGMRRHQDAGEEEATPAFSSRRRGPLLAGCALAAVIALAGGFLTGGATNPGTTTTSVLTTPVSTVASAAAPTLSSLASGRSAQLQVLKHASNSGAQSAAAAAISGDYRTAASSLASLPAPLNTQTKSVQSDLTALALDWQSVATAAGRANKRAYTRAASRVAKAERALKRQIAALGSSGAAPKTRT